MYLFGFTSPATRHSAPRIGQRRQACALILGVALAASATAADGTAAATGDEELLIVTGTRIKSEIESMPSFVTVLDREQIRAGEPASVLDLFRSIAGVNVSQYGGRGGVATVYIRGSEPNFTVVLIDGVKVNDPNNSRGGSFDFSTLNIAEIERTLRW